MYGGAKEEIEALPKTHEKLLITLEGRPNARQYVAYFEQNQLREVRIVSQSKLMHVLTL